MLNQVVRPDGEPVSFTYDALGRRLSKTYKGRVTRWVWEGDKPLHEWQELVLTGQNTEDVITWLFEEDSFAPIGKLQGTTRQSILTDHLGTPLAMVDQGGQPSWQAQTTAYGRIRLAAGTRAECPFRFQGQYEDVETGLYYNRFRYYDPQEGAYISQDPIGLMSGEPNLYSYVDDPADWSDPLGLLPCKNKKTTFTGSSRRDAFRQAKRDADIPMSQQPHKVSRTPLDDGYGNPVLNKDGIPVQAREYHYKNNRGENIIVQEHSLGHTKATSGHGLEPHFNVRPSSNPRTGSVENTHGHYNFPK